VEDFQVSKSKTSYL